MSNMQPKYAYIKNLLLNEILAEKYKPMDMLPSDNEMIRKFSVSKSTITKALNLLVQEGYIFREQGRGTFVSNHFDRKVIEFYLCSIEENEKLCWSEIVNSFNEKNKDFSIHLTFITDQGIPLRDTLYKAFASGNSPDIISIDGPDTSYWAYINAIRPLDDYMTEEFKNRFVKNVLCQGTYRNKIYQLGYSESTICIIYNKSVFERLKIRPPKSILEAWTWDEFLQVCEIIKKNTSFPYPLLMNSGRGMEMEKGEWITYSGLPFIYQNNGTVFSDNCLHTNGFLNSPKTVEAMSWLGDLFHKYHYTHIEDLGKISHNEFAMSLSQQNSFIDIINHQHNTNIGVIPLPHNARQASPHGGWGLSITTQTQYPELCWKFIEYVFTIENQIKLSKVTGMPVLNNIYNIYQELNSSSENLNLLFSQLHNTSVTRPVTPAYPYFSKLFSQSYIDIAKGGNAEKVLTNAALEIDSHIERHGGYLL